MTAERAGVNLAEESRPKPPTVLRDRISYNAVSRFAGRGVGALLSLFALHLSARYFGPFEWGRIVTALAFVTVFSSLADVGISSLLSRDLAKPDADVKNLFVTGIVAAAGTSLLLAAVAGAAATLFLPGERTVWTYVVLMLATIPLTAVFAVVSALFVARGRNDVRAGLDVLSSLVPLAGVAVIVLRRSGGDAYAILQPIVDGVTLVTAACFALRYLGRGRRVRLSLQKVVLRAAPLGLAQLMYVVYGQIDMLLVASLVSGRRVGLYALAIQLTTFVGSIPGIVNAAAIPVFMRKDTRGRYVLAQRLVDGLCVPGVLVVLGGTLFPSEALWLIGGDKYLHAAGTLAILLIAVGMGFVTSTLGSLIYLLERQMSVALLSGTTLCVNVVCTLVGIPLLGIEGAAVALVASELYVMIVASFMVRRFTTWLPDFRLPLGCLGVGVVVGGGFFALRSLAHLPRLGPWVMAEGAAVLMLYGVGVELLARSRGESIQRLLPSFPSG